MKWITVMLLAISNFAEGQKIAFTDGNLVFDTVVEINGAKNDLFLRAQQFIIGAYKSGKDVTQMIDKESGIVIGRGTLTFTYKLNLLYSFTGYAWHSIKIIVKDNKYKVELTFDECKVDGEKWIIDKNINKFYEEHNGDKSVAEIEQKGHAILSSCVSAMAVKQEDF